MAEGAARGTSADASPSLTGCLMMLARRHGLAEPLAAALTPRPPDRRPPSVATLMRRARKAGLRCRRRRLGWDDLRRQTRGSDHAAVVSFSDGSSLLLLGIVQDRGTDVALLEDPRSPGFDPIRVDHIRFVAAWTGSVVEVRMRPRPGTPRPFGWRRIGALLLGEPRLVRDLAGATLGLGVLAAVPILVVQLLIGRVLPFKAAPTLLVLAIGLAAAVLVEAALGAARGALAARLSAHLDARLATALFDRLLALPAVTLGRMEAGEVLRRMLGMRRVSTLVGAPLLDAILAVGVAAVVVPLMIFLAPVPAGLVVLALLIGLALLLARRRAFAQAATVLRHAEGRRAAMLLQTLNGMDVVKGLALAPRRLQSWDRLTAAVGRAELALARPLDIVTALAVPAERLLVGGTLALGILLAIMAREPAPLAPLLAFYLLAQRLLAPLRPVAALLRLRAEADAAMADLAALVNQPAEPAGASLPHPLRGGLAVADLRFRYPGGVRPALDGVSFTLEPGATLGIMGRSGAGKSTIARLLQRHETGYGGTILLDGVDIAGLDPQALRRAIVVVRGTDALFAGTIREVILATRPDAGFEVMVRAARAAGADGFIDRLPRGYETWLDEGAPALSSGQRQRLALARALLADPAILVLDEALSALDAEIATTVEANLRETRRGSTTIVISHRLSALVDADAILVMEEGRPRDIGPHDVLLERCETYGAAWLRQQGPLDGDGAGDHLLALS